MDTSVTLGSGESRPPVQIMSEAEMKTMHSIFARAADTIVEASRLAVEVRELSQTVNALKTEVEAFRIRNNWLDEQLTATRATRDDALAEVTRLKAEVTSIETENIRLVNANDKLDRANGDLQDRLEQQVRTNTELTRANLDMRYVIGQAQIKLDKLHDVLGVPKVSLMQIEPAPEPEPLRYDPPPVTEAYIPPPYDPDGVLTPTDLSVGPNEGKATEEHPWWKNKATA